MSVIAAMRAAPSAPPMRRGACPALSAPMQTGDGLLIRLSPVSGGLSPAHLIGLCQSALRNGNGIVEVTARGSLQFRGFSAVSAPLFACDVEALGMAVRTGVPVETSPVAGIDPAEIADPTLLVESIRERIADSGLSDRLGPKVSVVIDGGGAVSLDSIADDLRLTAQHRRGRIVWRVSIGGSAGMAKSLGSYDETSAIDIVLAILADIAALGIDARARDLFSNAFESWASTTAPHPSSPSPSERKGSAKQGVTHDADRNRAIVGSFFPIPLNTSQLAVPVALPFGHADATTLIELASRAETLGVADIRPAPDRRLLFVCPAQPAAAALQSMASALGFVTSAVDPRSRIAACPGTPACASGHIAARRIATDVAAAIGSRIDSSFSLHISGCEKGCARQSPASITVVGGRTGVGLVVGGTARDVATEYATGDTVVEAVVRLASSLQDRK